jgi:hypothetical protein
MAVLRVLRDRWHPVWLAWATLFASFVLGCGGGRYKESMAPGSPPMAMPAGRRTMDEDSAKTAMGPRAELEGQAADVPPPPPGAPTQPPPSSTVKRITPLLIYTAELTMAVFEAKQGIDNVEGYTREIGGYLVRRDDTTIVVRVPAEKYGEALKKIAGLGDVLHREERVEDVTDQFMDLQTRLANARALRARIEELLKQAKDVKEALAVEHELARITGEIESMEGRLKRLRELINFSTITVRFQGKRTEHVEPKVRLPFPWLEQLGLPNLRSL